MSEHALEIDDVSCTNALPHTVDKGVGLMFQLRYLPQRGSEVNFGMVLRSEINDQDYYSPWTLPCLTRLSQQQGLCVCWTSHLSCSSVPVVPDPMDNAAGDICTARPLKHMFEPLLRR